MEQYHAWNNHPYSRNICLSVLSTQFVHQISSVLLSAAKCEFRQPKKKKNKIRKSIVWVSIHLRREFFVLFRTIAKMWVTMAPFESKLEGSLCKVRRNLPYWLFAANNPMSFYTRDPCKKKPQKITSVILHYFVWEINGDIPSICISRLIHNPGFHNIGRSPEASSNETGTNGCHYVYGVAIG